MKGKKKTAPLGLSPPRMNQSSKLRRNVIESPLWGMYVLSAMMVEVYRTRLEHDHHWRLLLFPKARTVYTSRKAYDKVRNFRNYNARVRVSTNASEGAQHDSKGLPPQIIVEGPSVKESARIRHTRTYSPISTHTIEKWPPSINLSHNSNTLSPSRKLPNEP